MKARDPRLALLDALWDADAIADVKGVAMALWRFLDGEWTTRASIGAIAARAGVNPKTARAVLAQLVAAGGLQRRECYADDGRTIDPEWTVVPAAIVAAVEAVSGTRRTSPPPPVHGRGSPPREGAPCTVGGGYPPREAPPTVHGSHPLPSTVDKIRGPDPVTGSGDHTQRADAPDVCVRPEGLIVIEGGADVGRLWEAWRSLVPTGARPRPADPPAALLPVVREALAAYPVAELEHVVRWAHESLHPRAADLRRKGCLGLGTLLELGKLAQYAELASGWSSGPPADRPLTTGEAALVDAVVELWHTQVDADLVAALSDDVEGELRARTARNIRDSTFGVDGLEAEALDQRRRAHAEA
jgi:hypothetical protein